MILIADAGATKTDWRLIDGDKVVQFKSEGFNPRSHAISLFESSLPEEALSQKDAVKKLYYYGAGLADQSMNEALKGLLSSVFAHASVVVETDLLGAARSLFGKESGIACILGTGSAACYYDGCSIAKRIPPLGYVLGDEGSGSYLGKKILNQYLRGLLPDVIQRNFQKEFGEIKEETVLHNVYQEPKANTYLARFASFIINNQSDPFIYRFAYDSLEAFFVNYFSNFEEMKEEKIRFTGSIAYFLSNVIRKFASDHQLKVDLISQNPISGLTLYHKKNG